MNDVAAQIAAATARGDVQALSALAIELVQEVSRLSAEAAVLEQRRKKDAERKRNHPRKSVDVRGTHRNGAEIQDPPSPQVSSSSPTPLITPSFPPSPLPPQAPQGNDEETRLRDRAPEAWPVIVQFLEGKESPARMAWIGRFHGALDRPPHPTGQELADAIGDLMTTPREQWVPTLFRRYVERIRRDATTAAERATGTATPVRSSTAPRWDATVEAGNLVAEIRELAFVQPIPGQGDRKLLRNADVERMGEDVHRAYRTVGGASRFLALEKKPDDLPFLINNFAAALAAARALPKEAQSA